LLGPHTVCQSCDMDTPPATAKYKNHRFPVEIISPAAAVQGFWGVSKPAKEANLNATTLDRTLSPKGNPALTSLTALLRALGMQLAVRPLPKKHAA
jgi:DNA-binding phage protein